MQISRTCGDPRPLALHATTHRYVTEGEHTVVNRFLGFDAYEWFVMLFGTAVLALATWVM
jgi:hypothetical protein